MLSTYDLSTAPTRIELSSTNYSELNQRMDGEINRELTITYNQTQTYDHKGKVNDRDND